MEEREGPSMSPRTEGASSHRTDSIPVRTLLIRKRGFVLSTPAEYHHVRSHKNTGKYLVTFQQKLCDNAKMATSIDGAKDYGRMGLKRRFKRWKFHLVHLDYYEVKDFKISGSSTWSDFPRIEWPLRKCFVSIFYNISLDKYDSICCTRKVQMLFILS